jgi:hypothetical protein
MAERPTSEASGAPSLQATNRTPATPPDLQRDDPFSALCSALSIRRNTEFEERLMFVSRDAAQ